MSKEEVHDLWCNEMVQKASNPQRNRIFTVKNTRKRIPGIVTSGYSKGYLARQIAALF